MADHKTLAAALAAFQADLPAVGKNRRNNYGSYADIADVAKAAHPELAKHGLSFSAKPTLNEDGAFVLSYVLRHVSGEEDHGEFPLPAAGNMQAIGGAITYARRYSFCAVTGIVADEDTDGAGDDKVDTKPAQQRRQQKPKGPTPDQLRETIANLAKAKNLDHTALAAEYEARIKTPLEQETDPGRLQQFIDAVNADRVTVPAASS